MNGSQTAYKIFRRAYEKQMDGQIEEAIDLYKTSISLFPTPEAHTYLGWAYSLNGHYREAISECMQAIELDPGYGNPYNDIGSYLISLDEYDEAITWLKKAVNAERYEPRHYPFFNLGRVYELKGMWWEAREYYYRALDVNPDFEAAKLAVIKLTSLMN